MPYNPGVHNQAGEIIGDAIRQRNQSLAQLGVGLLTRALAKNDANKEQAKSDLKKANSLRSYFSEVDPGNAAKYKAAGLPDLEGMFQARPEKQAAAARSAVPGLVSTIPDQPGPLGAVLAGLKKNPAVLDSAEGKDALAAVLKGMVTGQKQPPRVIPLGDGQSALFDPNSGRATQMRPPPRAVVPQVENGQPGVIQPNGSWRPTVAPGGAGRLSPDADFLAKLPADAVWNPVMAGTNAVPGIFQVADKSGKHLGYYRDTQSATRTGGGGGKSNSQAPNDPTAAFKSLAATMGINQPASTKTAPAKGDVVKGYQFQGGDPADKNNWSPVGE